MIEGNGGPPKGEQAVGVLLKRLTDQTRRLAQQEVALARAELSEKAKTAGLAAGLLGAAALLGLLALLTLTAAAVLALATAVAAWLAALIVAVVCIGVAGGLGLLARARLKAAAPLAPVQTVASVKEDVSWLKSRIKFART